MAMSEQGNEWTKVLRIYLVTALKIHCFKTSAQELYICASVHMHMLAGAGIMSHRSDLCLVYHFACNLNITGIIHTLLF